MINVNELMLGNYVFANNKIRQIVSIYPGGIDYVENDEVFGSLSVDVKLIQITSEWLELLGFERIDEYTYHHSASEPSEISVYGSEVSWRFSFCDEMGIDRASFAVWHIHQLQRHFYNVTGDLLTKQTKEAGQATGGEL